MKPIKTIIESVNGDLALVQRLIDLSKGGGAWVYAVLPFSKPGDNVTFYQFQNPSRVPDYFMDLTHDRIGFGGKIVQFTKTAKVREQNRGVSGD